MELEELQKHWKAFGEQDPLWAILSHTGKRYGGWDPAEFFRIGEAQVRGLLEDIDAIGISIARGKALDFGCGVGRLTQALADHFAECRGVDISPSMIEHARSYNRHGERCQYLVNDRNDLSLFDDNTFDLVYSIIVLQHMQPRYALNYIDEFLRILTPGGLAVFQVPGGNKPPQETGQRPRTAITAPLPLTAFNAKVTVVERPRAIKAGDRFEVHVQVKNQGDATWPALGTPDERFRIHLGNHWLDANRSPVIFDDGRAGLPHDVDPGEEVALSVTVNAPRNPGHYLLEIDMVQEQVAWFKDRGSDSEIIALDVQPTRDESDEDFTPQMQMYHVKQEDILDLVERRGAKVVSIKQVNLKSQLLDYNYYISKS